MAYAEFTAFVGIAYVYVKNLVDIILKLLYT